jgi:thermostable 8-oxoguanine DNA glycosylase
MVDPINFTNFNRTDVELEETALFSVLVAGKNALVTAKSLENLLVTAHKQVEFKERQPFNCMKQFKRSKLADLLHEHGIGCYTSKSRSVDELVNSELDLRNCSVEDLEEIYGIGSKTARMFVMHTRPNQEYAALDVHILKYLRDCGYDVPGNTPGSKNKYKELEVIFLELAKKHGKTPADFDLDLWREYRNKRKIA